MTDSLFLAMKWECTRRWQMVEMRIKTNRSGNGHFFYTNTDKGQYGGFSGKNRIAWQTIPDGQWHEYRLFPFWEEQNEIIRLRLDFPKLLQESVDRCEAEIAWIRIVEPDFAQHSKKRIDWNFTDPEEDSGKDLRNRKKQQGGFYTWGGAKAVQTDRGLEVTQPPYGSGFIMSEVFSCDAKNDGPFITVEMEKIDSCKIDPVTRGAIRFAANQGNFIDVPFFLSDTSIYNIDLSGNKNWKGKIRMIGLNVSDRPGARMLVKRISINKCALKNKLPKCTIRTAPVSLKSPDFHVQIVVQ